MYYFIDFSNSGEFSLYLLTPEQGTDIVVMNSGDAIFISYRDTSNQDVSTTEFSEKGVSDMTDSEKQKVNYDPNNIK